MFSRRDTLLLLIGVLLVAIGGTVFFIPLQSKAEELLGAVSFYLGGSLAFVGAAIRFFG
jgi:hypothetical protein